VALNKKRKQDIVNDVNELAEDFTQAQQDKYKPLAIKIALVLNEGIEDTLAGFRKEASLYVTKGAPTKPDQNHEALELASSGIKKILQEAYNLINNLSRSPGVKVAAIDAIKEGLEHIQRASLDQAMLDEVVILEAMLQ